MTRYSNNNTIYHNTDYCLIIIFRISHSTKPSHCHLVILSFCQNEKKKVLVRPYSIIYIYILIL